MAFKEDEVWQAIFKSKEDFKGPELQNEEATFFGVMPGLNMYLITEYENQVVRSILHAYNN